MLVEIRIYRRHDADLIMLKSYGINISKMMRLALENYVAGERVKFRLPDAHPCDISDCSMLRYRLDVKDPKVIQLLKSVKKGYRNQFCKALLRDMMDSMALGVYLDTEEAVTLENKRVLSDSLLASSSLGLITKRKQLETSVSYSSQKHLQKDKETKLTEKTKKDDSADLRQVELKFKTDKTETEKKDVQTASEQETVSKANETVQDSNTTETDTEKQARSSMLFSMFQSMRSDFD